MEFVSKEQAYDAARRLIRENGLAGAADGLEFKDYENAITADPLSPRDALCAVAETLADRGAGGGFVETLRATAADPEKGDVALWNRWIDLLGSV